MTGAIAAMLIFLLGWLHTSLSTEVDNRSYEDKINDRHNYDESDQF